MISVIFGTIGIVGATIAHNKNKNKKDKIERLNDEMESIISRTERQVKMSQMKCDFECQKFLDQQEKIYRTTFENFKKIAGQIKNITINEKILYKIKARNIDVKGLDFNEICPASSYDFKNIIMYTTIGYLPTQIIYSFRLDNKIEEARAEKSKLEAKCAAIRTECIKMNSITGLYKTANNTIETLQKLADKAVDEINNIIDENGTDYNSYPESVQDQCWLTFNVISALSNLINTEIVDKNGNVNKKFEKFIKEVHTEYLEA